MGDLSLVLWKSPWCPILPILGNELQSDTFSPRSCPKKLRKKLAWRKFYWWTRGDGGGPVPVVIVCKWGYYEVFELIFYTTLGESEALAHAYSNCCLLITAEMAFLCLLSVAKKFRVSGFYWFCKNSKKLNSSKRRQSWANGRSSQ